MKSKRRIFGILAIMLAVGVLASYAEAAGKLQLRLNLKKGKTYGLRTIVDQEISQEMQGQEQAMTQKISMGYTFYVEDVDADGVASIKVAYDSITFEQSSAMRTIAYDSSKDAAPADAAASAFAALVGQSFSVKIAPDGSVKGVKGVDELVAHVMGKMDVPDGAMKTTMEKSLKNQFGEQGVKDMMVNITGIYPDGPVSEGDSWNKRFVMSAGMGMILESACTLKKRKNGVAIIDVNTKISPNTETPPMDMGFAKISYDISGVQKGTVEVDEATGWPIRSKFTQEFSGITKVEGATSMEIPISVKSLIRLEPLEEK